jgi:hypothetical protein
MNLAFALPLLNPHGTKCLISNSVSHQMSLDHNQQWFKTIVHPYLFCSLNAGSDWHVQHQNEQNHLLSSDLPRFMMDSYEECRDPPRLYLLDK